MLSNYRMVSVIMFLCRMRFVIVVVEIRVLVLVFLECSECSVLCRNGYLVKMVILVVIVCLVVLSSGGCVNM